MTDLDIFMRGAAFALLAISLSLSALLSGRRIDNIALWNGLGMLVLYACYCLAGLRFANGVSTAAELMTASFIALGIAAFIVGEWLAGRRRRPLGDPVLASPLEVARSRRVDLTRRVRPVSSAYLYATAVSSAVFYALLTRGQPWRLLTDSVGLKVERLEGIAEKSPLLLNLDALVLAMLLLALAWSIVAYRDDRRSRISLVFSALLMGVYVMSTGSRTPLIAVALQVVPALAVAQHHSREMAGIVRSKWMAVVALCAGVAFMIATTGARIEFEALSDDVFRVYFNITEFGSIDSLLRSGEAASFFASTAVTYAASTFNNIVIRFQELGSIEPTYGYRFLFFYVSAVQLLLGNLAPDAAGWRDLATTNNDHLTTISAAAGQWATPYGDLIWDFGVAATFVIVVVVGIAAGLVVGIARRRPTFRNVLLKVFIVGFSLSPLVNPFLSLYVHYGLAICIILTARQRRRRGARRWRQTLQPRAASA